MPTFFKANENLDTQEQILPVGRMKLCLVHSSLLVKVLLLNNSFVYAIHLNQFFEIFETLSVLIVFFLCLEYIMCLF